MPLFWSCSSGSSASADNKTANAANSSAMIIKDISVADLENLKKDKSNLKIVDVRTPKEVAAGKIDGSVAMDFYADDFKTLIGTLDKGQPTLVYCKSGGRSGKTMKMMKKMGFKEVYNLEGGYTAFAKHYY